VSDRILCRIALGQVPVPAQAVARDVEFFAVTARAFGVADSGYRVVTNTGPDVGQEVVRLHRHIIGGEPLGGMV
jgi:histidine triad (HIT) family protein